jgi:ABC-type transport system substrate-binding protein
MAAAAKPTGAAPVPTAAAVAPTSAPATASGAKGRTLKVALGAEPRSLDPTIDAVKSSVTVSDSMLETLAVNTASQEVKPWLAESWEVVAPDRWRLHLKKGVKFHDGEDFNADAVTFALGVYQKTQGMSRGWFDFVDHTEKVDDFTIDLVTKEPTGYVPSTLAFFYALPPKYYVDAGDQFGNKPVGTGPWQFGEWNKGVSLKVQPFPGYWGAKPSIGDIEFRWAPDASTRVSMLQTGEADLVQNIPPALVDRVEQSGNAHIAEVKSARKFFMPMNTHEGPTADVRIRKAINYAVDTDSIIKNLFRGRAYGRDKGIIHEGFEGYQGDKLQAFPYDPEMAKKLMTEAGYPNGFETTVWVPVGRYTYDQETGEAIVGQLA